MGLQRTVAETIRFAGQSLHLGLYSQVAITALPVNSGIQFERSDLPDRPRVSATTDNVISIKRSVAVGRDGWSIATVEHLMAAFCGLEIDNALVSVSCPELPAGDGSALFFCKLLLKAGSLQQPAPRKRWRINRPLWVETPATSIQPPITRSSIVILPSEQLAVSCVFDSPHPVVGSQYFSLTVTPENFLKELAPARTIAFMEELELLRHAGLALCDDPNCAVLVGNEGYLNELRFMDEIVRHKILDLLGDLFLAGRILGHIIAICPGHTVDFELAKLIQQDRSAE